MQEVKYRKDYRPSDFTVHQSDLRFEIFDDHTLVTGRFQVARKSRGISELLLCGDGQEIMAVRYNDKTLTPNDYERQDKDLMLPVAHDEFTIEVTNKIYPHKNLSLDGLYASQGMLCTQCEPHGFRKIIYSLDRPDVMSSYTTTIIADKKKFPVLLSNGNCLETKDLGERHQAVWQDPFKKPSYLFALVAGQLEKVSDTFTTMSGRKVDIHVYARKEDIGECHYALVAAKEAMRWDEVRFGREYDLDTFMIVAVSDFNMGAMENKGLNIFNTKYVLANENMSTDQDYEHIQSVIGHEYFHNWTGNRVTCRDWFQLSLKEGLTVFRDQEFTRDHHEPTLKRIDDVKIIRTAQFAEDASPMAHPIRPDSYVEMNNFYTVTVYNKGAEVIRMIHTLLGEKEFRAGMDLYFKRHDGEAVTCEDFVKAMEDASQKDLTQFRLWYSQAGTPTVQVREEYDAKNGRYLLHFTQSCPPTPGQTEKQPFHIPVKLGLVDSTGKDLVSDVISLTDAQQILEFTKISEKPVPSLFRDFSAPVKMDFPYSDEALLFLLARDSNAFNRWDAGQKLATKYLLALIEDADFQVPQTFLNALGEVLRDPALDCAFIAEVLLMPSEKAIAELLPVIHPGKIHQAREKLVALLCHALNPDFKTIYSQLAQAPQPLFDAKAVSARALKNVLINYLLQNDQDTFAKAAAKNQYDHSTNMTSTLGALSAVVNSRYVDLKAELLDDFYQKWQHQPLVVDKWLSLQALSKSEDTLDQVKKLTAHPVFNIRNPNKVYSLLSAFTQNQARFHDEKGKGYAFIGEKILEIDAFNGIVAARLARSLINYRRFAEPFQSLMRQELEKLSKAKLSNDVHEIVQQAFYIG